MLYREIIAVCSEIHTKHINTLCGQNVELLNVKLAVRTVTTGLPRANTGGWLSITLSMLLGQSTCCYRDCQLSQSEQLRALSLSLSHRLCTRRPAIQSFNDGCRLHDIDS
jgi:hypothetical protein